MGEKIDLAQELSEKITEIAELKADLAYAQKRIDQLEEALERQNDRRSTNHKQQKQQRKSRWQEDEGD